VSDYKIKTKNCTFGKLGETVTDKDLEGLNIEALIDGGHLAASRANKKEG